MSAYSKYTDHVDSNIRNAALLLETAQEALDDGEVSLEEFKGMAYDILDIYDDMLNENKAGNEVIGELTRITNSIKG